MNTFEQYPPLNPSTFAMLQKNTMQNPAFLAELFESFISDTQELMVELQRSAEQDNFEEYYTAVHTLKGLSGTIGCSRMFEVLKVMDSLNKEKNFNQSRSYLQQLSDVFSDTREAIKSHL